MTDHCSKDHCQISIHCVSGIPRFIRILLLCLPSPIFHPATQFFRYGGPNLPPLSYRHFHRVYHILNTPPLAFTSMELGHMLLHDVGLPGMLEPIRQLSSLGWEHHQSSANMVRHLWVLLDNIRLVFLLTTCSNSHYSSRIRWSSCLLVMYQSTFIPDRQWRG